MKNKYITWLADNEQYKDLSTNLVRIDMPFLNGSFDEIVIYAETLSTGQILLTDGGWTMDYLESHGLNFRKGSHRYNLLHSTLNMYGLEINDDDIQVKTSEKNFPTSKQRIMQGLIKINDLLFMNDRNIINTFKTDIEARMADYKILYDAPYSVIGKNGYTYSFDYSIPQVGGSKKLVNAITQPNKIDFAKLFVMDVRLSYQVDPKTTFFAILNDQKEIKNMDEINDLFLNTSEVKITPIMMSDSESFVKLLNNGN